MKNKKSMELSILVGWMGFKKIILNKNNQHGLKMPNIAQTKIQDLEFFLIIEDLINRKKYFCQIA